MSSGNVVRRAAYRSTASFTGAKGAGCRGPMVAQTIRGGTASAARIVALTGVSRSIASVTQFKPTHFVQSR